MGNFWGDFAGAFQKSYDSAQRNSRENAAAKRDEERFAREKQQWGEEDQLKTRIGAAGWTLDDPTKPDGLMTADDYNRQFAAPPSEKGKKPKKQALPTMEAPPVQAGVPGQSPQAIPVPSAPAPQQEVAPKAGDFVAVEVNGQIMYAPKGRVKMKDNATYIADVGRAVMPFDKTVGANMMAAAQVMEGRNLELASQKWGQAVIQAQRLGGRPGGSQRGEAYRRSAASSDAKTAVRSREAASAGHASRLR